MPIVTEGQSRNQSKAGNVRKKNTDNVRLSYSIETDLETSRKRW